MSEEMAKAQRIKVGQVWESCDGRFKQVRKRVVRVGMTNAYFEPVDGGRKTRVNWRSFLARQGYASGYRLVEG